MTDGFDAASAVTAIGDGAYAATLHPHWTITDKPHGGYLFALMARAGLAALAEAGSPHQHPLAVSAQYLSPPAISDVTVQTEVLRVGRSASQVRCTLHQEGTRCVEFLMTAATLPEDGEPTWTDVPPPAMPAIEACFRQPVDPPGLQLRLFGRVGVWHDPPQLSFAAGQPNMTGELRCWVAHEDGREPDPLALLLAVDALPPATLTLGSSGWVPTLELTAYIRAFPAPGPLLVRQKARHVEGNFVDESCDVWDSRGRLVAQATQLAGVRMRPRST